MNRINQTDDSKYRKMTMFASQAPGDVIDAIRPDLEAFTSLWTALRVKYEGTNITRTVARLLHMYQPEDGVIAYERLLRTLFVLLEDFDNDGLQLLVSMVPPPKGISDELVKEVFNQATGFVRVDAPIFHENTDHIICTNLPASTLDFPYPKTASQSSAAVQQSEAVFTPEQLSALEMKKNLNPMVKNDKIGTKNRTNESPQTIPQESSEVFRGFPPSEIFNTQSHVQSIKNLYRPSASYVFPQSGGGSGGGGGGGGAGGQSFVNFGQIVGQNSGQLKQSVGSPGLVAHAPASYRPKWFQSPYHIMHKNSYPAVNQYQDYYLKTVNNQYVKVPASKVNSFHHQGNVNSSQASYQNLFNNAHADYLRNRSNTVTSGLLEKIQRHRDIQEAAMKKILNDCEVSKKNEISTTQANVEFKIVDTGEEKTRENLSLKKNRLENLGMKTQSGSIDGTTSEITRAAGNNEFMEFDSNEKNSILNRKTFEEFAKEVRMRQRAIQEDIFKMDVVRSEELGDDFSGIKNGTDNSIKPEILTASEGLMNSCKKFMDRAKSEELIEVPVLPKTRSLSEIYEKSGVSHASESNLWRLLTSRSVSDIQTPKTVQESTESNVELEDPLIQESQELLAPSSSIPKRVIRRKKGEVSSTRSRNQKVIQKGTVNHVINLQDDSNLAEHEIRAKQDVNMKNNSQSEAEPLSRCQVSSAPQITSSITAATTMAELAAYKKQYYDALLSIQKAKAAVTNSLAISSVGSSPAGFDPFYYSYLQQQHRQILQRHQHQFLMGHRFPQQRSMSAVGNPWFRNTDWRYPVISQSRLPQRPQMLHPSSSMWPPGVGFIGRESQMPVVQNQRQQRTVSQVSKPPVKRRKLEEIVGRLKETENSGTNGTNENELQINN